MRHFFKTEVIKLGELLSAFQKKQKDELICVKLLITLIFCNEKVPFIDFFVKDLNKSLSYYRWLKPFFEKFHLLRKLLTKLKLIFCSNSRYIVILISLTRKSQI